MKEENKEVVVYSFPKKERMILSLTGLLIIISGCILFMYKLPNLENILSGGLIAVVGFIVMSISRFSNDNEYSIVKN